MISQTDIFISDMSKALSMDINLTEMNTSYYPNACMHKIGVRINLGPEQIEAIAKLLKVRCLTENPHINGFLIVKEFVP